MTLSPQETEDLVAAMFRVLDARDVDAAAVLVHPEIEFQSRLADVDGGLYRGREGIATYFKDLDEAWTEIRWRLIEIAGWFGDSLVIDIEMDATGRASGILFQMQLVQVWRFRDGKPWKVNVYTSRADAMDALGG